MPSTIMICDLNLYFTLFSSVAVFLCLLVNLEEKTKTFSCEKTFSEPIFFNTN